MSMVNDRAAAELLGISRHTVRKLVREKALPHFKIGRRTVFDAGELSVWLRARRVAPADEGNGR